MNEAIKQEQMISVLKEEFGIHSSKELEDAIRQLGRIDISPFCRKPNSVVKENVS